MPVFPLKLTYTDIASGVLIMLLAFTLRCVVVFDRAHNDPAFDPLPPGTDQRTYIALADAYTRGEYPDGPFVYQPAIVYYFVGLRALVGESPGTLRLATSLTGALSCGLLVGAGWLLTGRRWGGLLAGGLLAVYPVAIFYATELLIADLAACIVVAFVFCALWQGRRLSLWRSLLLGLLLGLLTITRTNLALLALAWLVYLWSIAPSGRVFAQHAALTLLAAALPVAPVTLWNVQAGQPQLVSSEGTMELYRANSRDSSGLRDNPLALQLADEDRYITLLWADVWRDPLRFVELQARKAGLFWNAAEPANNIDYIANGEAVSPLLRLIPLDFRLLALTGLLGIVGCWRQDKRSAGLLAGMVLLIFAGVLAIWVLSRVRYPVVVPLAAGAAFLLLDAGDLLRGRRWHALLRRYVLPGAALLLLFAAGDWAIEHLPRKHTLATLPADVVRTDLVFDETLRLVGWRALPEYPGAAQGWIQFGTSYAVELFWSLERPTTIDYQVSLAYVDDGVRYGGVDVAVGTVSYPATLTSGWQPGTIYSEIIGFRLPFETPKERSGAVRIGVYRLEGTFQPGQPDTRRVFDVPVTSLPDAPFSTALQSLAVLDYGQPQSQLTGFAGFVDSAAVFGGQLALRGYALPVRAAPGANVPISFHWAAVSAPTASYVQFIHVEDSAGVIATQVDTAPRANRWLTSTWAAGYPLRDDVTLTLPAAPGVYRVYTGWYLPQTGARLAVQASAPAPDDRLLLGEIVIER